jgi:hypothetical protein
MLESIDKFEFGFPCAYLDFDIIRKQEKAENFANILLQLIRFTKNTNLFTFLKIQIP